MQYFYILEYLWYRSEFS